MGMSPQSHLPEAFNEKGALTMKKILILAAAIALVSSTAFAAGTATLTVSASVTATCTMTDGTLAFGALNPLTAADTGQVAAAGVSVTCTNGTLFTVTDDAATNDLTNGTSNIPFTLTHAGAGAGTGVAVPYAITGEILGADYADATAGAYISTVTLTFNP
jgi:spore coat protein U-like protein